MQVSTRFPWGITHGRNVVKASEERASLALGGDLAMRA